MRTQQLLYGAAGVVILIILLLVGVGLSRGSDEAPRARGGGGEGFVGAVDKGQQGTVMITVSGGPRGETMPMGSGFVVSSDGLVVTADHVTRGLPVVSVVFADGSVARAELIGADETADVAVYSTTPGKPLSPLTLADSNQVKAGQPVVLMGAPYGLVGTATSGIVSAINRQIGDSSSNRFANGALSGPVTAYIQTDAPLTAGGSGGPLLNAAGQVIGMASARESRGEPGAGLAFAIPSNLVRDVVDQFKNPPAVAPGRPPAPSARP